MAKVTLFPLTDNELDAMENQDRISLAVEWVTRNANPVFHHLWLGHLHTDKLTPLSTADLDVNLPSMTADVTSFSWRRKLEMLNDVPPCREDVPRPGHRLKC